MDLRETSPLPARPLDLAQFIATSITFTASIRQVSVFLDDECLFQIQKAVALAEDLKIPASIKRSSPLGYMKMSSASTQAIIVTASVMRWVYAVGTDSTLAKTKAIQKVAATQAAVVKSSSASQGFFASLSSLFSAAAPSAAPTLPPIPIDNRSEIEKMRLEERRETVDSSVQLQIFSATVAVKLPNKIAADIERATKKKTPSTIPYQIVYVSVPQQTMATSCAERSLMTR